MITKQELRRQLLAQVSDPPIWDGLKLIEWLQNQSGVWGVYQPLKAELDPQKVIRSSSHLKWVYPRVQGTGLSFHSLDDQGLIKGSLAWEPPATAPEVASEKISGLLIPGLAFDSSGVRLGRGKGYYDRFLATFSGIKVGVISKDRIFPKLPSDVWDIRMDYLATEDQLQSCP